MSTRDRRYGFVENSRKFSEGRRAATSRDDFARNDRSLNVHRWTCGCVRRDGWPGRVVVKGAGGANSERRRDEVSLEREEGRLEREEGR